MARYLLTGGTGILARFLLWGEMKKNVSCETITANVSHETNIKYRALQGGRGKSYVFYILTFINRF